MVSMMRVESCPDLGESCPQKLIGEQLCFSGLHPDSVILLMGWKMILCGHFLKNTTATQLTNGQLLFCQLWRVWRKNSHLDIKWTMILSFISWLCEDWLTGSHQTGKSLISVSKKLKRTTKPSVVIMPRSFLVKKTEKVKHVLGTAEPRKIWTDTLGKQALKLETEILSGTSNSAEVDLPRDREKKSTIPLAVAPAFDDNNSPALPPSWMLPYHPHHPGLNTFDAFHKLSAGSVYAKSLYLRDERPGAAAPPPAFLPYSSAIHPLAVQLENSE